MIISKVKKAQEEYKEAYKKVRILVGANKVVDGTVKLAMMVLPVANAFKAANAFKSMKILASTTTIGAGTIGSICGLSDIHEGYQDIKAGVTEEGLDKPSRNFAREAIGEKAYPWVEGISMIVAGWAGSKLCLQEESAAAGSETVESAVGVSSKISKKITVTEDMIKNVMKDAPYNTQQKSVSIPVIQNYVDRILAGEVNPPKIKVDGNIIVDGNYRYIASRIAGIDIGIQEYPGGKADKIISWLDVIYDLFDWGNR